MSVCLSALDFSRISTFFGHEQVLFEWLETKTSILLLNSTAQKIIHSWFLGAFANARTNHRKSCLNGENVPCLLPLRQGV